MVILIAMANNLGIWIKEGLNKIGKNQVWLADKVGVEPPQISRIISGESEARPELLNKIADALHKPRVQAYRAAGHLSNISEQDEWIEQTSYKLSQLDPARRQIAENLLDALLKEETPAPASRQPRPSAGKA